VDLSKLIAEVTRLETLEAGVEAAFAAQGQKQSDAVAAAIAKTMADANATAVQVQAAAQAALDEVQAQFTADNDKLSAALVANVPPVVVEPPTNPAP
jgi:hypothetical protein